MGGSELLGDPNNTSLKYITFTTSEEGNFRITVNDGGSTTKQYPATNSDGLLGEIGKTYYFDEGSPTGLIEIDDSVQYSISFTACSYSGSTALSDNFAGGYYKRFGTSYTTGNTFIYYKNQPVNVTAAANSSYSFDKWYSNSSLSTTASSSTALSSTATANANYYAKFVKNTYTIYFTDNASWGSVYCYAYIDGGNSEGLGAWPGTAMTYSYTNGFSQDIYVIEVPADMNTIIFNNNNSSKQTVNISITGDAKYYTAGTDDYGRYKVETW